VLLIIEMFICSLFMPPDSDINFTGKMMNGYYVYSEDGIMMLLTLLKLYLFGRAAFNVSTFSIS